MLKKSFKPIYSPSRQRPRATLAKERAVPRPSRSGTTEATSANVKVCVRVRPPNERETESNRRMVVDLVDDKMLIFDPKEDDDPFFYQGVQQPSFGYCKKTNKQMQFMFDRVFDCNASNEDVFDGSTRDIIDSLMEGYNCSVFVYGATGAGKTFTMLGHPEAPGITYLTMRELFARFDSLRNDRQFEICVSYLEIYNENVHDLLRPSGPLHLREDGKFGVQIAGLFIKSINTAQELIDMLDKGNKSRTQHPTDANSESSRSHAVFQVYIKMRTKASSQTKIVKLSMIDLAGSERASATGCKGERFKEGANINRSLLSLGNCINQLADGSKFIPYRDSKLTRLLKDSLGGNCRTVMIANIGPTTLSYEDTYNTLKYATRASKIKHKMKKNIINCDNHVSQYIKQTEELQERVAMLEEELAKAKERQIVSVVSVGPTKEESDEIMKLKSQLQKKSEERISLLKKVLKKQRKQRGLAARAARKRRAAMALALLCGDVPDAQLKEACRTDVSRLQLSSNALMQQVEILQGDLQPFIKQTTALESDFKILQAKASDTSKELNPVINEIETSRQLLISQEKSEHLEMIAGMQQDEINKLNLFMKNSLESLKKNYLRLKAQGMFTTAMHNEYNDLIRQAKDSRSVKWEDDDETVIDDHFKYLINIDPCSIQNVPKLCTNDIVMSPLVLANEESNFIEKSSHESDYETLKDSTVTINDFDDNEDNLNRTYTELNKPSEKRSNGKIDPSLLNSTFNINQNCDGEPVAKKVFHKLPQKHVLSERTNKYPSEKIIQGKMTPKIYKTPIITVTKENKSSGFGSTLDRFQKPSNGQSYKALRGKERLANAGAALPYSRPTPLKSKK